MVKLKSLYTCFFCTHVAKAKINSCVSCREKRIDQEARMKPGSSMDMVWIEIRNPTDNDKGKYTLEMFDGKETHKRYVELSGQGECNHMD